VAGTVFIACGAFWLSFTALTRLAAASGIDPGQAWAWPLIVDGIIVVATVSVVALAGRKGVWYPWALLAGGAAVSVAANAVQAALSPDAAIPRPMAAAVAAVPPVVLLAATHLTVVLTRPSQPGAGAPADAPPQTAPTPEPAEAAEAPLAAQPPRPPGGLTGGSEPRSSLRRERGASPAHAFPRLAGPPGGARRADGTAVQDEPPAGWPPRPGLVPAPAAGAGHAAPRVDRPTPEAALGPAEAGRVRPEAASPLSIYALAAEAPPAAGSGGRFGGGSRTWLVEEARRLRADGMSFRAIGKALGRNGTTIARWLEDDHETGRPGENDAD
jgi:hypothetical protein